MVGIVHLALMTAVLCGRQVAFVDPDAGSEVLRVSLGGEGLAVFAAPDGSVLVPLQDDDATAVVSGRGTVRRWRGRLFPLFFDEPDRLRTVVADALLTLSYPERLPLARLPLPGIDGAWRAGSSSDGQLVFLIPAPPGRELVVAGGLEAGAVRRVPLAGEARVLAVAPGGEWAAVGLAGGALEMVFAGESSARPPLAMGGSVHCLAAIPGGRDLLLATEGPEGGQLVGLRLASHERSGIKERFRTSLSGPISGLAAAAKEAAAVTDAGVVFLSRGGRKLLRTVNVTGAREVVFLPAMPVTTVPHWSDQPRP
jgi:hypothetical protein